MTSLINQINRLQSLLLSSIPKGGLIFIFSTILVLVYSPIGNGQTIEQNFETRISAALDYDAKYVSGLSINFAPELRLSDNQQEYMLDWGAKYKVADFLKIGGEYKLVYLESHSKGEMRHYFALQSTISHRIDRLNVYGRIKYSSYTDNIDVGSGFLRFKGYLKYDIFGSRLSPLLGTEMFTLMENGQIVKYRYSAGLQYKINHQSRIKIQYKIDYFKLKFKNNHILSIVYSFQL